MAVILDVGPGQRDPRVPEGIILRQDPPAGQPMPGRRVTVWPSAGYPLPNFVRQPVERARDASRELEFRLEEQSEERVDVPRGIIFDQDPPAETLLPFRDPVRVRVSRGFPVPEFIEQRASEALEFAEKIGIRLDTTARDNPLVPSGIIFDQQPRAGELLPPDRTVRVTVSNGYPLPDLVGMHEDEARRVASELSFGLDVSRTPLPNRIADHIDMQKPGAGTRLPLEGPVSVVVSAGWPTPDFRTLDENEAAALAGEKQVMLRVIERRQVREPQPGIVIDQNPPPGVLLPPGQAVNVVVSASDPTPRLIGLTKEQARAVAAQRAIELAETEAPRRAIDPGRVAEQSPEPDAPLPADGRVAAPLPADGRVAVVISTGWPTPDFVGKTEEEANSIAAGLDITLVETVSREHFELSSGRVIEQEPVADAVLPPSRRVGWPVAPDAVGQTAGAVRRDFLARHPNAVVDQRESLLTLEPAGTVISQHPEPNAKLGRGQRLELVASAVKPPWAWPAAAVVAITLGLGVFAGLKAALGSSAQQSVRTENPGGVRLRVTKDHGVQTTETKDEGGADRTGSGEIVQVDLGEQSAGPIEDTGDKP
jgi:beta-lactam-binding protein with PASTA domain